MRRIQVISGAIASIGYNLVTWTLEVEFHDGEVYQFIDVSISTWWGFLTAESKGGYYNDNVVGQYGSRHM